jgi:tRNA dimethylallyltransferase
VGKTEFVRSLARTEIEIINTDSMQVYRGMDIGTAKPSPEIRAEVPHHLIDICDPDEQFEVGRFVREADRLCGEIAARGRLPLLSGGTAFYFYHFIYGLPETPPADPELRAELQRRLQIEGLEPLRRELERRDPASAERIAAADGKRLLRALEVYYSTGKPLSAYRRSRGERRDYRFLTLGLHREREELYRRIDHRVEEMWHAGLPEEVGSLITRGYGEHDPGMRGIGYREFFLLRRIGELTAADLLARIQRDTRRYAKRQLTFFRRIPGVEWYTAGEAAALRERVERFATGQT